MEKIKGKRIMSTLIDLVSWYLIMYFMILFWFFAVEGYTPVAGDLQQYKEMFDNIMFQPTFIISFIVLLLIWEVAFPLLFGGQTPSKKIMKLKILPFSVSAIFIRGFVRIITINPSGIISYVIAKNVGLSINIVSNILSVILLVNVIVVFYNKRSTAELLSRTHIEEA